MTSQKRQDQKDIKNQKLRKQLSGEHIKLQSKPENLQKSNNETSNKQIIPQNAQNKTEEHPLAQIKQSHLKNQEQSKQNEPKLFQKNQLFKIKTNQEILMEVKKWKQISETLQKKREIQYQLFKKKIQFEKQKQQQQHKQKSQKEQEEKRQQIKKRLQQINLRKQKRDQSVQNQKKRRRQAASEQKKDPLYQQKQKQFHMKKLVEEAKIRENIIKKKQQMMLDMNELREHEQRFLNHLKQRLSRKKKNGQNSPTKQGDNFQGDPARNHKSSFNIFAGGIDNAQKQKDKEKYLRRKKFQQKVKKIPIFIDEEKMKQALIAKDKSKNPLKYNYLSNVAALSDEKIYDQFKDFQININQKQLGNDYMRQVHENIPSSSRIRSHSESRLQPLQRPEYKNYMPDVKGMLKKKMLGQKQKSKPNDEVQEILYKYESNSDRLVELNRKSDYYKNQVLKKIAQIRSTSPTTAYTDYLGKEKTIDDLYMKSIKMKIATAQIS